MATKRSEESNAKLRFGYVSDYDKSRHMARVIFPELDNLVSGWLQIICEHSWRDYWKDGQEHKCICPEKAGVIVEHHDEYYLNSGEHVACLMQGNGTECGVILGCVYDDKVRP